MSRRYARLIVWTLLVAAPQLAGAATIKTRSGKAISGEVQGRIVFRGPLGPGTEGYAHSIAYSVVSGDAITSIDAAAVSLLGDTKIVRVVRYFSGEEAPDERHTLLTANRALLSLRQRAIGMSLMVGNGPSLGKLAIIEVAADNLTEVLLGELADTSGQQKFAEGVLFVVPNEEEAKASLVILQRLRVKTQAAIEEIPVADVAGSR